MLVDKYLFYFLFLSPALFLTLIYYLKEVNDRLKGLHKCCVDTYLTSDYIKWILVETKGYKE